MKLKYVRFFNQSFIIFPTTMQHDFVVRRMGVDKKNVDSAGFMTINDFNMHGESESLGIKSMEEDAEVLLLFTE